MSLPPLHHLSLVDRRVLSGSSDYLRSTRHPWASLLFLAPLLSAYEAGVVWLGGSKPDMIRNGADAWMRWGLESFGLNQLVVAPGIIGVIFVIWTWWRWAERPKALFTVLFGMLLECLLFALGLWAISHGFEPLLKSLQVPMATGPQVDPMLAKLVTFVGAGIYEETLFRLALFSGLSLLLRLALVPKPSAVLLAASISAVLFAGAHHVGPYGEKMDTYVFLFRTMAGVYFALVYQLRGFGVAAGSHACYDLLVGLMPA
ncbi:MAG TPA: CPBP family glutamic-type intramembrane protease [Gemmataceae bacterium]|nr:CPBP family glutamic-type intramembrane protease [Gemmataceae bacterium]